MNLFRQPYPCTSSVKSKLATAGGFGLFVFVFLLLFRPFNLDSQEPGRLALYSAIYGLITFVCIFGATMILRMAFPVFYHEKTWTTGKEIIHVTTSVVVVGLVNYLVSPLFVNASLSWENMLWFQGRTMSIAILPIVIYTLFEQNLLLKKFKAQAARLEKQLHEKQQEAESSPPVKNIDDNTDSVTLTGDYQNEKISVSMHQLYFITAASNYVKVFIEQNGKVSYAIIRMTMKKAEECLEPCGNFFRCHRAYIINLDKVVHVAGNAQGYRIQIDGVNELIPVSRNLNNEFSDRLLAVRRRIA